jgi:hypothetical protein
MDPFKKYIQENREALDTDAPRPLVWERIEKELPVPPKKISTTRIIAWSAAACVVVLAGIGIKSFLGNREKQIGNRDLSVMKPAIKIIEGGEIPDTNKKILSITANSKKTGHKNDKIINQKNISLSPTTYTLSPISQLESSFTQIINLQKARISATPMYTENAAYFDAFKVEMRQMEKDEVQVKKDISSKGMTNELLDQLINIYQQKLNILKQLQLEMNKTNNRYKQNRASVDTVRTYFLSI